MRKAFKDFMEGLKKDERGMTLVELLAVVVILAIVGVIAFVAIGNVIENSKKDAHIANAQQVISSAELYEAGGEEITTDMSALTLDTMEELIDPWTKSTDGYDFKLNGAGGDITVTSEHNDCKFTNKDKATLASEGRKLCDATSGDGE